MEVFTSFVLLIFSYQVDANKYQNRIDHNTTHRVKRILPAVHQTSEKTGVPPRFLIGIAYTETNADPSLIGDGGRSYGIGQIRCRIWLDWLRNRGVDRLRRCNQLLRPYTNLRAVGEILSHLRDKSSSWTEALEKYNSGQAVSTISNAQRRRRVVSYRRKVLYFAKLFEPLYEAYEDVRPILKQFLNYYSKLGTM